VEGESSSYESYFQRTSSFSLFSTQRRACPVLKHNQVSEVFEGFKVHDFEYYGQRNYGLKWKFFLMSLEICHLLLALKTY